LGHYYILPVGHPDTERGIDGVVTGLVNPTLGPDGFPVVSAFGMTNNGASHPITDRNGLNEILWWTPGQDGVTAWKTQVDMLPLNLNPLFPFNNGCDGACGGGYVAAYWTGVFNLASPGTVTFNLGSDDDAWVFVDNMLQVDNGGIHGFSTTPTITTPLSAGSHTVDLFFADRHTVQSGIFFSADVAITATPEPASLLLLGSGLLGAVGVLRRKINL
jgi:fibro-slime domain-containing protein